MLNSWLPGCLRFGFGTAFDVAADAPSALCETKSVPAGSKFTSPGSNRLLPFRSCQRNVDVRNVTLLAMLISSEFHMWVNRPQPPLTIVLPLPVTSHATCARGVTGLNVLNWTPGNVSAG